MNRLRLHVISCPVFRRELELLVSAAKTAPTFQYLEMGLHEQAAGSLRAALQAAMDAVPADRHDAIALGYGLCNRAVLGLRARTLPVVIPRAHDCIGMLLGGSRCYLAEHEAHPGTYFQSAGWLENAPGGGEIRRQDFLSSPGGVTREQLVEKYGEDNADYLLEQYRNFTRHYERLAYISTPVPRSEHWEGQAKEIARVRGWKFERLPGDMGWLRRMLDGEWDPQEFLMLKPGEQVVAGTGPELICAEPV